MRRLSFKLIFSLVGALGLVFALFGYQLTELHRSDLEKVTFESANRISDSIKRSILYSMQQNHREHIYHSIVTIGGEPGINKIRIFNEVGRISFSSDAGETNTYLDKRAEACFACHNQEEPLRRLDRSDRTRIYRDSNGQRILGVINAIENEATCWDADCHAHSPNQQILGVLDVTMSLAQVDEITQAGRELILVQLTAAVVVVSLVLGALVWLFVHRPIRILTSGIKEVASGDLSYRISIQSNDEMGTLGRSFNEMTGQLEQARRELTAWTNTLESRVQQKAEALSRAHHRMIQVERLASMGKLAAIVAHEINNPLAGILTSAKLVRRRLAQNGASEPTGDTLEQLDMIAEEARRCGEIVKNLLQFSRPQKEARKAEDINFVVSTSLRLVQHKIDLLGLETKTDLAEGLPLVVCDSNGIRQALVAVLINACEAVGSAGGEIQVGTRLRGAQDLVEIWVRDTGSGMNEHTRQRIFEPFFTTKEEVRGVGLGMAVVSGIVNAHGGEIEIDSQIGAGTCVSIALPVAGAEPDAASELSAESTTVL